VVLALAGGTSTASADPYWLDQAKAACNQEGFRSFFEAFVRSDAVRKRYTATTLTRIEDGKRRQPGPDGHPGFPIALADYTYVAANAPANGRSLPYLRVRFGEAKGGVQQVHWVRIRYEGNGNDRDGQARIIGMIGKPGRLSFQLADSCWQWTEDATGKGVATKP
jgi:hypothetical protein